MTTRVLLSFLSIYVIWGSTYLAIRLALETLPPFLMAGLRFLVAGAAMLAWARAHRATRPTWGQWRDAFLIGGLLLLGGNGGVVWAEQYIPSSLAAVLVATVPLWLALMDRRNASFGPLFLGFLGVAVLLAPTGDGVHLLGAGVVLAGSVCWALGSHLSRRVEQPESPVLATGMQMLAGGVLLTMVGLLSGETLPSTMPSTRSLLALGYLTVFGSLVAFTAYVWLLRHVPAHRVGTYAYVNPAVAVLLGWGFAGEAITAPMGVAMAMILLSVVALLRPAKADSDHSPGLRRRLLWRRVHASHRQRPYRAG